MDQQRPPPEVTIRDPARPAAPLDVVGREDDAPRGPRWSRRRSLALGLAVAAAGGAVGVAELRERRTAEAEERRLASVVDLSALSSGVDSARYDSLSGEASLGLQLSVRNDGPRRVTLLQAEVAGFELRSPVGLPPDGREAVALTRTVACSPDSPPDQLQSSTLSLLVQTEAGTRRVQVPLAVPVDDDSVLRICGFLPIEEAVYVNASDQSRAGRSAEVLLEVNSLAVRPTDVVDVVGDGLRVELHDEAGRPQPLPRRLLAQGPGVTTLTPLHVTLTVDDCEAAGAVVREQRLPELRVLLRDERGRVAEAATAYDPQLHSALVDEACR